MRNLLPVADERLKGQGRQGMHSHAMWILGERVLEGMWEGSHGAPRLRWLPLLVALAAITL